MCQRVCANAMPSEMPSVGCNDDACASTKAGQGDRETPGRMKRCDNQILAVDIMMIDLDRESPGPCGAAKST